MLSGTLPHNKWHAFGGYIVFGKEQPFDTFNKFLHAFSSFDANGTMANPREDKTRLLQKFLQAFTICHPASILNLQECQMMRVRFRLLPDEAVQTSDLTSRYEKAAAIDSSKRQTDGADGSIAVLGLAVKAKMSSLHPILGDLAQSGWVRLFEDLGLVQLDDIEDDIIGESISGHERDKWLQSIRQEPDLITNSGRLQILIRLLNHIRTTYEGEKTVIFADSLRFLDIVAEQIRRTFGVECLRFDGTVPGHKREEIEEKFAAGGWDVPMVITTTSGK
jgi:superfamily II DNA or RNA helicase